MFAFLPKLEDTLIDLLLYGDTGALEVSHEDRRWTFFVQGGVLIGIVRTPPLPEGPEVDPGQLAVLAMTEAMTAPNPLWDFREGAGPEEFGLFDARRALVEALGRTREPADLLDRIAPVLEGWPALRVDADTLTDEPEIQAWLRTLDGLAPGSERLVRAPPRPGPCLGALWVAWKLGDLELNTSAVDDAADSLLPGDEPIIDDLSAGETEEVAGHRDLDPQHDDEQAEADEATHTHHTEPIRPGSPLAERSSAVLATMRQDPFIQGVALARAGDAKDALPLLELAFEDDPERPGLEEWLGYARFAVHRDDDPEQARAGLNLLREVMYRTGPTGETAILPWILMARAQFERGDLVQARGLLASVLEKEPDDPEAMHLDGQLRQVEQEAEKLRAAPEGISLARVVRMTGLLAVLAALVVSVQVVERYEPPRTDYAGQFAEVAPLRELHRVPRGWVAVPLPGTPAEQSPQAALETCRELAQATHLDERETMTVVSDLGVVLAECGERLQ